MTTFNRKGQKVDLDREFGAMGFSATSTDISTNRLLIGQGFNSISGEPGGQAVIFNFEENELTSPAPHADGQEVTETLEIINSFEELKEKMHINASISLGFGLFKTDATFDFIKSGKFSQYNSYLYLNQRVLNSPRLLKRSVLTAEALSSAKSSQGAFLSFCGDSYVYGTQTGGELTAIIQITSTDVESYEKSKADLKAAYGAYVDLRLSLEQTLEKTSQTSQTKVHILRKGGIALLPEIKIDKLIEASRSFYELVVAHPVVINTLTRGYNTVTNFPVGTIDLRMLVNQAKTLDIISDFLDKAYRKRADLTFISEQSEQFDFPGDLRAAVDQALEKNAKIIRELLFIASEVAWDPTVEAPLPPSYPSLDPLPTRKHAIVLDPPAPPVIEMYNWQNFADNQNGGNPLLTSTSIPNLIDAGFNDKLSSLKVNGKPGEYTVEFFNELNYQLPLLTVKSPYSNPNLHELKALIGQIQDGFGRTIRIEIPVGDAISSVRISRNL